MRRRAPRSLRAQLVVTTVLLMLLLVVTVGVVLRLVLEAAAVREIDHALQGRTAEVVDALSAGPRGALRVDEAVLDPGEVVFDGEGSLAAGSIERRAAAEAARLARPPAHQVTETYGGLRLRATPVRLGDVAAVVVVGEQTGPYERSEDYALAATTVLGLLAVSAAGLLASRATTTALAPVRLMAQRAEEWHEVDLGRRFGDTGRATEIRALAQTLDHMLDRVARAIRAEQRLTSELAHELRTPLASVQGAADLALLRGDADPATTVDLEQISASARSMGETITTLLELARDNADVRDTCTVAQVVEAILASEPQVTAEPGPPSAARIAAPLALVLRALAPVLDNARRFARAGVTVACSEQSGFVEVAVHDDGAGFDPVIEASAFEPGVSGSGSSGLGLALSRRVARSFGGEVWVSSRSGPGSTVVVQLPVL